MQAILLIIFLCLCGCSQKSPEYFQERGRGITAALIEELSAIDDVDALLERLPYLESLFEALVDQIIEARKWQIKQGASFTISEQDAELSAKLASELHRLMLNPLACHVIEKSQQKALERLDAFEKRVKASPKL